MHLLSFPEGEAVAAATEEGTQVMISRETQLKRYNVQHFECVGADISRPKANETELYRRTAQSRYPVERQIAAPYELRSFWRIPLNALLSKWRRCGRLVSAPTSPYLLKFYLR